MTYESAYEAWCKDPRLCEERLGTTLDADLEGKI